MEFRVCRLFLFLVESIFSEEVPLLDMDKEKSTQKIIVYSDFFFLVNQKFIF